jgi:aspartyl-tRNA(Asn)/glutamyl-tRNA(Gln) amidotransferase subunit C
MDTATVRTIAYLARIRIEDKDLAPMAKELSNILGWVEQLNEIKTEGVEPMTSVAAMTLPRREDKVTDGGCRDSVVANATDPEDGFYTVPKVVE